jgi:hypothetical protein
MASPSADAALQRFEKLACERADNGNVTDLDRMSKLLAILALNL